MELYAIIIASLGFLFTLFTYFGMHPHRVQLLAVSFIKLMQRNPRMIVVVLFALILANLIIIGLKIEHFSGILIGTIGAITGALIVTLVEFLIHLTIGKIIASRDTQLLAVIALRFHGVSELPNEAKIVIASYGAPAQWLQTALDTYRLSFVPVLVPMPEVFEALRRGVVDAVLVRGHPLPALKETVESGIVRLLPWSKQAIEAVTRTFPATTRPSKLPVNTYRGQTEDIQGYAPY